MTKNLWKSKKNLSVNEQKANFTETKFPKSYQMKKLLLLGLVCGIAGSASAQFNNSVPLPMQRAPYAPKMQHRPLVQVDGNQTANKGTAVTSRWYNHAEAIGDFYHINIYDNDHSSAELMWQDSSVHYAGTGGVGVSPFGIPFLSIGQTFDPQATTFTDLSAPGNVGQIAIGPNNAYTIDSVRVRGFYVRKYNTYVDTMIFTIITETTTSPFLYAVFFNPTNYNVDSFAYQLWNSADYFKRPINEISYSYNNGGKNLSSPIQVKVPLTNAQSIDTMSDGSTFIKAAMNVSVPKNARAQLSITFASGTHYTANTSVTNYNFFEFLSHEQTPGDYTQYPDGDKNMSSVIFNDTVNSKLNATLNRYRVTAELDGTVYNDQLHNIGFHVVCPTCYTTGVTNIPNTINIGIAYPDPAVNTVTLPMTIKTAATVSVTLSNMVGQILSTQNLGNVAANQQAKAVFNTAALANGIYMLTVSANGERTTSRFVVSH